MTFALSSSSCKMSGLMVLCAWVVAVTAIPSGSYQVEASRVFKVGNEFGWRVPDHNNTAIYSHWATSNRFHIADSLSFVYENDSVVEVDKWGYYHCNGSDPIMAFDNGNSTVKLDRPGPFYFISGVSGHCKSGQRLIVEVMHIHHQSPSTIAAPPNPYSSIAPSPFSGSTSAASSQCCYSFASVLFALASTVAILWSEP